MRAPASAWGHKTFIFEDEGAFTGEISVAMLKEIGVDYCIVGHSERRQYFAETDETVNFKLKKLLTDSEIRPILCVGEPFRSVKPGERKEIVATQIRNAFDGITGEQAEQVVVAYEPIWAIGTGKTASPEQAEEMCAFIRKDH